MKKLLLVLVPMVLLSGCGTPLGKVGDWLKWWDSKPEITLPEDKPDDPSETWIDEVDLAELPGVKGWDTRGWKITSDLQVRKGGDGIRLDWNSTQWKSVNDNVGSVWCAYKKDGKWSKAWRYDQIRRGQHTRDYPMNPPHPKGDEKYDTVPADAELKIIWISTMARKAGERNGEERTKAAILTW